MTEERKKRVQYKTGKEEETEEMGKEERMKTDGEEKEESEAKN